MIKLSKYYNKHRIDENIIAIFNALTLETYFVNEKQLKDIENITNLTKEEEDLLIGSGIYVTDDESDEECKEFYLQQFKDYSGKINTIFIIPTSLCNLRCKYCAIKNLADNENDTEMMKKEVIDSFLIKYNKYIKENDIKKPTFIFYGGEPLANWEIIEYVVNSSKKIGEFTYQIITNGTLLDEEKLNFIKSNSILLGLSVDGSKELNDSNRVFANSSKSVYETISEKIKMMNKLEIEYTFSITLSNEILANQEEFIIWLNKFVEEFAIKSISYNLLRFNSPEFNVEEYNKKATEFIIKSYNTFKKYNLYEDKISKKLKFFSLKQFFHGDCAAVTGNQIVLKPNGDITVCQAHLQNNTHILGNILDDEFTKIENNNIRDEYYKIIPIMRSGKCETCEAISICGGGCYWEAIKNEDFMDYGFCEHTKQIFYWMLSNLYVSNISF